MFVPNAQGTSADDGPQSGSGGSLGEQVGTGQAPSQRGGASVPLSEAMARYHEQATRALDDPSTPPGTRALIAGYLDRLAAGA